MEQSPGGQDQNTKADRPNPNLRIINPYTRLPYFGTMSRMVYRNEVLEEGKIVLLSGQHKGPNRGYGVEHILREHQKSIVEGDMPPCEAVALFVADIVQAGSAVHCEFSDIRGRHRPLIVKTRVGLAVLEPRFGHGEEGLFYSVVTAFKSTKAKGPRVGTL